MKVLHVITGLETGGAEKILVRLVRGLAPLGITSEVVALAEGGTIVPAELSALGVPVTSLAPRSSLLRQGLALGRLARIVASRSPDVIQGWMYHGNVAATLAASIARTSAPQCWSIHHTLQNKSGERPVTRAMISAGRHLSQRGVAAIHYVSHASEEHHRAEGYRADVSLVIPNACDCERFSRDPGARARLGAELGVAHEVRLVGHVAGFRAMKDHATLIAAARIVAQRDDGTDVRFVLVGPGVDAGNAELAGWIRSAGLAERVHLLGERDDVVSLMSAFDVLTLTSAWGESCPTVVLEAMACETPCVVTDVGDARILVDRFGRVVGVRDPAALAAGWAALLALPADELSALGADARRHVADRYALDGMVAAFAALYERVVGTGVGGAAAGAQQKTPGP